MPTGAFERGREWRLTPITFRRSNAEGQGDVLPSSVSIPFKNNDELLSFNHLTETHKRRR